MIIVSDTTTITNLFAIGHFHLLPKLFGQIILPERVFAELSASNGFPQETQEQVRAEVLLVQKVENILAVRELMKILDAGEAEAIILAEELRADTLIMDERKGRIAARWRGLRTIGLLGIILQAKEQGIISRVRPVLDELRTEAHFYFSQALYHEILRDAGED